MRRIFRENGLTIVFTSLFLIFWVGQSVVGHREHNNEQREHGQPEMAFGPYLRSAHFWEATAENWESEFFQMFFYVVLTAFLYQKGSSESKKPGEPEPVDREPRAGGKRRNVPWPVRRGGLALVLYRNSLSIAFLTFFLLSWWLHAVTGAREYSADQLAHGGQAVDTAHFVTRAQFWFQSLQNWQSEFLAVAAIVVLTIFLRQQGSPESKPVHAPHASTGTE